MDNKWSAKENKPAQFSFYFWIEETILGWKVLCRLLDQSPFTKKALSGSLLLWYVRPILRNNSVIFLKVKHKNNSSIC